MAPPAAWTRLNVRWRRRAVAPLFLLVIVLTGCVDVPTDTGPAEEDGPAARDTWQDDAFQVVLADPLDAAGCAAAEILFEVPREHAVALLPAGLEPAPSPVSGANAAITLEFRVCAESTTAGGASATSLLTVMIEAPPVAPALFAFDAPNRTDPADVDTLLDFYALAAYTDDEAMARLFRQSGVPYTEGDVSLDVVPLGTIFVYDAALAQDSAATPALRAAGSTTALDPFSELRRTWRVSEHGVQLFEVSDHASGGPAARAFGTATCVMGDDPGFPSFYLPGCVPTAARLSPDFGATGTSYWFHGARINQ